MRLLGSGGAASADDCLPVAVRVAPRSMPAGALTGCRPAARIAAWLSLFVLSLPAMQATAGDAAAMASSQVRLVIPPTLQATGVEDIGLDTAVAGVVRSYSEEFCLRSSGPLPYRILARAEGTGDNQFRLGNAQNSGPRYTLFYRSDAQEDAGEMLQPGAYSGLYTALPRLDACEHGSAVAFDLEFTHQPVERGSNAGSLILTLVAE